MPRYRIRLQKISKATYGITAYNVRTQVRRYIFDIRVCERRMNIISIYYIKFIYIIIYINYIKRLSTGGASLDFTKCTCVPAFALP